MTPMDVIIIVLAVAFIAYVVIKTIRDKKKGKTSCGCDCGSCAGCSKGECPMHSADASDKE